METHGWSSTTGSPSGRLAGRRRLRRRSVRSRGAPTSRGPEDVMRATSRPSGNSAMVDCPSTQSGPWNSAAASLSRSGAGPAPSVGLPPALPVRDEAQSAVVPPARLAHRLTRRRRRPPGALPRRAARRQGAARWRAEGHDDELRGVPRHVGVVPHHDGHVRTGRVHRGAPKKSCPSRRTDSAGSPGRVASATTAARRLRPPVAVDLSHRQHPVAVRGDAQAAVVVRLSPRAARASSGRGAATSAGGRRRTTPAGPTGRRRRRHQPACPGTRQSAPPPYSLTRLRMLTPGGEWSRNPPSPARTRTTRPASAGRDSSQ